MSASRDHYRGSPPTPNLPPVLILLAAIAATIGSWLFILFMAEAFGDLMIALAVAGVVLATGLSFTSRRGVR